MILFAAPDNAFRERLVSCMDVYGQHVVQTVEDILLDYILMFVTMIGDLPVYMSGLPTNIWGVEFVIKGVTYHLFKSEIHQLWYEYFFT